MVSTTTTDDTGRRPSEPLADLRAAVPDAVAALLLTGAIFAFLHHRVRTGVSATLEVMPYLADANAYWMYWLCQAFGWSALLWAWMTTMLGLVRSARPPRWLPVPPARIERWHRATSLTTIGLMFAHAFLFFTELVRTREPGGGWVGRTWNAFVEAFVPGGYSSGTGRVAILLGLLAFYLAIPLSIAFYLRHRTGGRTWRALHRFVIVVYVLSAWHTLLYGTNVWFDGWPRTTLWLLQIPVAVLLLVRLLAPARRSERLRRLAGWLAVGRRAVALLAVSASILVVLAVVVTGRDGGRTPGVDGAGLSVHPWMVWFGTAVLLVAMVVAVAVVRAAERRRVTERGGPRS
ncbi:ferric reductase-like transmembrane domain-containing protein [Actinoalloteichus spitiensis]|uniref:ferric reductase-like transmembrane domain-containing protein n=1 Tax=Actinoalloteichus spitiensis TaxID=252394 RepID=UPI00068D625B|nr:ferric reductase-like transmembrane domain-containing protein [Actinoalloteichus spitiensis]